MPPFRTAKTPMKIATEELENRCKRRSPKGIARGICQMCHLQKESHTRHLHHQNSRRKEHSQNQVVRGAASCLLLDTQDIGGTLEFPPILISLHNAVNCVHASSLASACSFSTIASGSSPRNFFNRQFTTERDKSLSREIANQLV